MKIQKFDSINVVPFIDIMLVLLVIVLTTATFMAKGVIPVDLSKAESSVKNEKSGTLTITIKSNGDIFFNTMSVSRKQVESKLLLFKKNSTINISCDKNTKFDNFVYIIDILKQKGYDNLGIITKYE